MAHINPQEFKEAYEQYSDAIYRHCFFRVRSRELARDLMQEVFIKTWKHLTDGGEIEQLRPFLYTVANHAIIDWSRKKREASLETMQETGFDPGQPAEAANQDPLELDVIYRLLDEINPNYREAVMLRYIEDLQPKEIAKILNISENLVSVRIHQGLKQIKVKYGEQF